MQDTAKEQTLDEIPAGEKCVIVRAADKSGRLAPMGFIPGETVEVLRRRESGSVVRLRAMRVALGSEVTRCITVKTRSNA